MAERALRSLRRSTKDAEEHLLGCKGMLQSLEQGERSYELKSLEMIFDKLAISKQFMSEKLNTVSENSNDLSIKDEELEKHLLEAEAVLDNIETILSLTKQVIERERLEKQKEIERVEKEKERERVEREKEREYLHEKEKREFDYSCQLEIRDRESKYEIEKTQIEKEIEINRLRIEEVKLRENLTRQSTSNAVHTVSTKLPKLHIAPFNGNIMNWQSFWDAFRSAIHENPSLNSIDKFNYLKSFLEGKAKRVVEGLDLTSTNYEHAIELLEQRFGKKSVILSTRYSKLNNIPLSSNSTSCLRGTLDKIRGHLQSLESLGENVEHTNLVVIIQSKFPHEVLRELEIRKDIDETWTVTTLIESLERYISSIEVTDQTIHERKKYPDFNGRSGKEAPIPLPRYSSFHNSRNLKTTGQSLMSNELGHSRPTFDDRATKICRFCKQDHWSDECKTFPTIEARKRQINDSCYICLRRGHVKHMCKQTRVCCYCQQVKNHHRSLCPKRFKQKNHFESSNPAIETASPVEDDEEVTEESLLASGEQTLMQTAMTNVSDASNKQTTPVRVFFDTGSHRSYMTEDLAKRLNLSFNRKQTLTVFTFGSKEAKEIQTPVASVKLQTSEGFVNLNVNIVPRITGSITQVHVDENDIGTVPHTMSLADPLPHEKVTSIEFLIGNDYYCDLVGGEKKELKPGLYLLASKFGWILSGRIHKECTNPRGTTLLIPSLPLSTTCDEPFLSNFAPDFSSDPKMNMELFWNLETLGIKDPIQESGDDKALQKFNETVCFEDHCSQVTRPWKEYSPNRNFPELSQENLKMVSSELKGPKTIFEASKLARECPTGELEGDDKYIDPRNYSSLNRLLRVTAWVRRFIHNVQNKNEKRIEKQISSTEILECKEFWFKKVQKEEYRDLISDIKNQRKNQLQAQLGLYIGDKDLIRCRNRMDNLITNDTSQILLPKSHYFTSLLIQDFHSRLLHSGVSHTLSQIRKQFWIPQGRSTVKTVLKRCLTCKRHEGGPYKIPHMPPWPKERITRSSPFSFTGLDYLGPLFIRERDSNETVKVWICLLTCMSTRAIHLELASNLSAESFLLVLRRFIGRRGVPIEIISDNAPQFKAVKSITEKAWSNIQRNHDVKSYLAYHGVNWKFITEFAPWKGGFYERLVGLVKRALRKSIGKLILSKEQLITLITEVEAVINSRPLIYVGDDFQHGCSISPADFLTLNRPTGFPIIEDIQDDSEYVTRSSTASSVLESWKKGQRHLEQFWKLWRDFYLQSLQERATTCHKNPKTTAHHHPSCEDVVLVKDNLPRGSWKIAKIITLNKGSDGIIRTAKILFPNGKLTSRAINHLFPLETSFTGTTDQPVNEADICEPEAGEEGPSERESPRRTTRRSALAATQRLQEMFNSPDM